MFWNRHGRQSLNKLLILASRRSLETQDKTLLTQQWFMSLLCQMLMLLPFKWEKPPQLPWLSVFSVIYNKFEYISSDSCVCYKCIHSVAEDVQWMPLDIKSVQLSRHTQAAKHTHAHTHKHLFLSFFVSLINPVCAAHGSLTVSKSSDERRPMTELY